MNNALYYPITATPFKRNSSYVEILPNQLLIPYIRCYWGSEYPRIQVEQDESSELVIPDTCVDIIYHIDYTDNVVTGGFCGVNDCSFYANNDGIAGHEVSTFAIRFYAWSAYEFADDTYDCVRNNKCMNDCGECAEIPCKIWHDTRDPKFSDEEFNENIAMRMQTLKRRSDANVEK